MNNVQLIGRLTRDPELKHIGSDNTAICNFGIALNRTYKTASGEKREETTFVDCECWGVRGENLAKFFQKGKEIALDGALKMDQWEDKEGNKRSKLTVKVLNWHFTGSGEGNGASNGSSEKATVGAGANAGGGDIGDDIPF
jgi:single-strand DNA-binding protein